MEQIPFVAIEITENRHRSVVFAAGFLKKLDSSPKKRGVIPGKIIGVQKQKDPAAGLPADCGKLGVVLRPGQQEAGAPRRGVRARRHHEDPTLARGERGILNQAKAQHACVVGNRLVVIADKEGNIAEALLHPRIWRELPARSEPEHRAEKIAAA